MRELEERVVFLSEGQILFEGVHNSLSFDLPLSHFNPSKPRGYFIYHHV
jgi:hypothetical protein